MYEAPDRFKRMKAARLPDGESLGLASEQADSSNSPLKDVQLLSRARLAPFFAAANITAALMLLAALWETVNSVYLLPWAGVVAVTNLIAMQIAKNQSITHVGRSARRVPDWVLVGEAVVRGGIWLSLPVYLFTSLSPGAQVITASIASGLAIAGLALVVVPRSAMGWMCTFTAGIVTALVLGRQTVPFEHMLSIIFTLGVSIFGVLNVARWAFEQLKISADFSR